MVGFPEVGIPIVDLDSLDYDVIAEDLAAVEDPDLMVGVIEATGSPGSAGT